MMREKVADPVKADQEQVTLETLIEEYEQIEAQIQELTSRKQEIRKVVFGELVARDLEETSVITSSGTKFIVRIQKVKRETVDKNLLRKELGKEAERFIKVTETEFLSIRPAKKTLEELRA